MIDMSKHYADMVTDLYTDQDYVKALLRRAYRIAKFWSDDPRTNNGAILLGLAGNVIGVGANQFPRSVPTTPERLERPLKYSFIEHAERNAILAAARNGSMTYHATLFCPWFACADCARAIIQAGITRIIGHKQVFEAYGPGPWDASIAIGNTLFDEAGVERILFDGQIGGVTIKLNGQDWEP